MTEKNEEELVADILSNAIDETDKNNKLFPIAKELAEEIRKDIKNIERCEYIGKNYAERGDLVVYKPEKQYIELKLITTSKSSKGTLANTTQDALKEYNLIKNVLGWSEWREKNEYDKKVKALLNNGINYTEGEKREILRKEKVIDKNSEIEIKARILRSKIKHFAKKYDLKFKALPVFLDKIISKRLDKDYFSLMNSGTQRAVIVCKKIIDLARADLRSYIEDCSRKEINKPQFIKFITLLKLGFHTIPLISENINFPLEEIRKFSEDYYIYYYYTGREEQDRIKKESPEKIKEDIPVAEDDLNVVFDGENIWVFNNERKILQLKFHWRNVFFGIAVPSIEIFDRSMNHINDSDST